MTAAGVCEDLFGPELPVRIEAYDGSRAGAPDAKATLVVRSPDVWRYVASSPGALGLARAYVAGDLDVEGDLFAALALRHRLPRRPHPWLARLALLRQAGPRALLPIAPPAEEVRLHGRLHSKRRDAAAIASHYDVSNTFYRLVLGPSLTYSCAVFREDDEPLEQAQARKHELVCRKLGLHRGLRLLDVGCGWGSMVLHAVLRRAAALAVSDRVELRRQDYRDVADGPYDAISSIGMFEHVGRAQLDAYCERLYALLRPGGRLLNHGITRPAIASSGTQASVFIDRYVFPDAELHEVGAVVSALQRAGFEVRHVESLREHYARTLRLWVANLEARWDEAIETAGAARCRIWRLYMAACALNFAENATQIHQILAVRPDAGHSGMPLRPDWELAAGASRRPLASGHPERVSGRRGGLHFPSEATARRIASATRCRWGSPS
jgi:cyclopropane-fatty-acyl-phospholipid synthase